MHKQTDTKQRIYQCALELFAKYGYDATSIRSIADKACTNIPTIYYYFTSKEHLFKTILLDSIRALENSVMVNPNLLAPQRLKCAIIGFLKFCTQNKDITSLIFQTWFGPGSHHQNIASVEQVYTNIVKVLDDILIDGIKNGYFRPHQHQELSQNIIGILTNYIARMLIGKEDIDPVRCGETILEFIMNGISL